MASKIRIIGAVGSGKTTLARKISLQKEIPMYSLDDIVWSRSPNGDVRNSEANRDASLERIVSQSSWIIEGAHLGWSRKTFEEADQVILLHPNLMIRLYRITKRFILQKRGIEDASYFPTWRMYGRMFKWTYQYETFYKKQVRIMLKNNPDKAIEICDGKELGVYN